MREQERGIPVEEQDRQFDVELGLAGMSDTELVSMAVKLRPPTFLLEKLLQLNTVSTASLETKLRELERTVDDEDYWSPSQPRKTYWGGDEKEAEDEVVAELVGKLAQAQELAMNIRQLIVEQEEEIAGSDAGTDLDMVFTYALVAELEVRQSRKAAQTERAQNNIAKLLFDNTSPLGRQTHSPANQTAPYLPIQHAQSPLLALGSQHRGRAVLNPVVGNVVWSGDEPDTTRALYKHVLKALSSRSPGEVQVRVLDPAAVGANVGPLFPLTASKPVGSGHVYSTDEQVRGALKEVRAHIGSVHSQFLQGQYADLEQYNLDQTHKQPYLYVVAFSLDQVWNPAELQELARIAQAGTAAGVSVLSTTGSGTSQLSGARREQVEALYAAPGTIHIQNVHRQGSQTQGKWSKAGSNASFAMHVDALPVDLDRVARQACQVLADTVSEAAGAPIQVSRNDSIQHSSIDGVCIEFGETGGKPTSLVFDDNTPHGLVIGGTGSGKSTLLHMLIHLGADKYAPSELEFWLVDLKDGVEFVAYDLSRGAGLPHVKTIAAAPDAEYGLNVVRSLQDEATRRNKLFKASGVNSISKYRSKTGEKLPRIVLVLDEAHALLSSTAPARIETASTSAIADLAKRGRSAGIHVLLSSQSLAGMGTGGVGGKAELWNQVHNRVVLSCTPDDAAHAFGRTVPELDKLTGKGSGLLSSNYGSIPSTKLFRSAYLDEDELRMLRVGLMERYSEPVRQIIFTGEELPAWSLGLNTPGEHARVSLGRPMSPNSPIEVVFDEPFGVGFFGSAPATNNALTLAGLELSHQLGSLAVRVVTGPSKLYSQAAAGLADRLGVQVDTEETLDTLKGDDVKAVVVFGAHTFQNPAAAKTALESIPASGSVLLASFSGAGQADALLSYKWKGTLPVVMQCDGVVVGSTPKPLRALVYGAEQYTTQFVTPVEFMPWALPALTDSSDDEALEETL